MTRASSFALVLALAACSPSSGPQTGSQTNWLRVCDSSDDCGGLECLCGACTAACEGDAACSGLAGSSCIAPSDEGSIALCGGSAAEHGLCLPRCEQSCAEGTSCVAGVCAPNAAPSVRVEIDTDTHHQTLVGFGASLAYADDAIVAHPDKTALYDLVFEDAGLDVLRLRNRHEGTGDAPLQPAREIVAAAAERLGRAPFLFMTSGTPPVALKANGSRTCAGDLETCTLTALPGGGFDYAGFARYWRDSLEAYANADIVPDYVSIQNNPDWVPPQAAPNEACRFLPEEGTESLLVGGARVDVAYPGYREALAAVRAAIADLPDVPRLAAPEATGLKDVSAYASALGAASVDALALHLYGQKATAVDVDALRVARGLGEQFERPVFQTEMQADGLTTAVLMQYALTVAEASAYVQNDLVSPTRAAADVALILLTTDGLETQGPYYALMHFAKHTDPGWVRVDASSDSTVLLGSAWLSPDEDALTVVLVNSGAEDIDAEVVAPAALRARLPHTEVARTVFEGVERFAALGELSAEGVVRVPARSILTVALTTE